VDFALAGGDESMSRIPFYDFSARSGYKLGDRTLVDGTLAILTDPFGGVHMGRTAEAVARTYDVSRQQQDEFAVESQPRAASEAARAAFEESGSVTAGNHVRDQHDGAAALVLATQSTARERVLTGLVTLEAVAAAMDPALMGYAPGVGAAESVRAGRHHPPVTRDRASNSSWRYSATLFEVSRWSYRHQRGVRQSCVVRILSVICPGRAGPRRPMMHLARAPTMQSTKCRLGSHHATRAQFLNVIRVQADGREDFFVVLA
jgi:hypothetical protein